MQTQSLAILTTCFAAALLELSTALTCYNCSYVSKEMDGAEEQILKNYNFNKSKNCDYDFRHATPVDEIMDDDSSSNLVVSCVKTTYVNSTDRDRYFYILGFAHDPHPPLTITDGNNNNCTQKNLTLPLNHNNNPTDVTIILMEECYCYEDYCNEPERFRSPTVFLSVAIFFLICSIFTCAGYTYIGICWCKRGYEKSKWEPISF